MKKLGPLYVMLAIAVFLGLTACATRQDNGTGAGNNTTTRSYGTNQNWTANRLDTGNNGTNESGVHANTKMQMSQQIADQIAAMDGVRSANVILTDNNAYVAVQLDRNAANNNNGKMGATNATNAGANGGTTGTTDDQTVSQQMKQQIVEKVRSTAGTQVRNVFVSANPDFVQRLNNYAQDVQQGRPLAGLVQEFNTLVQRIFPTVQGTTDQTGTTGATLNGTNGGMTGTGTASEPNASDGNNRGIRAGTTQRTGVR